MPLISDAEVQSYIETELAVPGRERTKSFCAVWERVVNTILDRLNPHGNDVWAAQNRLARRITDAWRLIVPFTVYAPETEFPFNGKSSVILRGFYREAMSLKVGVRLMVIVLYDAKEREELYAALDEVQEFCDACLADVDSITAVGEVFCTSEGFRSLAAHLQRMLEIVLADRADAFISAYDGAMEIIDTLMVTPKGRAC